MPRILLPLLGLALITPLSILASGVGWVSAAAALPPSADTLHHYFGEKKPGSTPIKFSPGIVSTDAGMYGTVVFSPDHSEAVWAMDEHPGLFQSRLENGEWTDPLEISFLPNHRLSSPFFSADGRRLFFMAAGGDEAGMDEKERIMVAERGVAGWMEPHELDPQLNRSQMHWQFSLDNHGNLYFMGEGAELFVSAMEAGDYLDPVLLPPPINSEAPESSPNISPNGEMLLFDRWFQTSPYVRIMASFRRPDGAWSDPVDLSPFIGSEGNDSCARLSPDGQFLFFQSVREGSDPNRSVYWIDAGFLSTLRIEALR